MNNPPKKITRFSKLFAILFAVIMPPILISIVLGLLVYWAWPKMLPWGKAAGTWAIGWAKGTWASTGEWVKEQGSSIIEWITNTWVSELLGYLIVIIITLFIQWFGQN